MTLVDVVVRMQVELASGTTSLASVTGKGNWQVA
jgi:hypothetical protein